jgi:serine/threonine-protein kinase HipA
MEKVAGVVDRFCTFPVLERVKLFERTLFSFLVGNEDMHLKNFSLITRAGKVALSPAYDFLNTTIALPNSQEELALPLNGKKSKLTRNDFLQYFARERLQLNEAVLAEVLTRFREAVSRWRELLAQCFLSAEMKQKFLSLLEARAQRCLS